MESLNVSCVAFACLVGGLWGGRWLRSRLPAPHRSSETNDTVKLAMGLVATMTALMLGLLISSAKSSYDSTRDQVMVMSAKVGVFDRVLSAYGDEAEGVRDDFRLVIEQAIPSIWSAANQGGRHIDATAGNALFSSLERLQPETPAQESLKGRAVAAALDLAELRMALTIRPGSAVPTPFLVVIMAWLVLIFVSFSVMAPSNGTASVALHASALSVAGAVFLLLELHDPFRGVLRVSSLPLEAAMSAVVR